MKKVVIFVLLFPFVLSEFIFAQNPEINAEPGDLQLIKASMNFNQINGGFYSEYIQNEIDLIYYSAIIKNVSQVSSTLVTLKIDVLNADGIQIESYYSESIDSILPQETDTIQFAHQWLASISKTIAGTYKFAFVIESATEDMDLSNNVDTLFVDLFNVDWVNVSRSITPTGSLDIDGIDGFQSGDFLGVTLQFQKNGHQFARMVLPLNQELPATVSLTGQIFENENLIFSEPMNYNPNYNSVSVYSNDFICFPNVLYYFGVKIEYSQGDVVPIGIDTLPYHNFDTESAAKVGEAWQALNFVPVMQLILDPEGISQSAAINQIPVYPNPSRGFITISKLTQGTALFFNLLGEQVSEKQISTKNQVLNVSDLDNGTYFLILTTHEGEKYFQKIIIQK
jgi:hypothetical protein